MTSIWRISWGNNREWKVNVSGSTLNLLADSKKPVEFEFRVDANKFVAWDPIDSSIVYKFSLTNDQLHCEKVDAQGRVVLHGLGVKDSISR